MILTIKSDGKLERFANQFAALAEHAPLALGRALQHTGAKAKTQVIRALTTQTGLPRKVIVKAVKVRGVAYGNPERVIMGTPQGQRLSYTLETSGGDISLKFFKPRETRAGVSAAPWGVRRVFPGTFLKGGRFPSRLALSMGGHVFMRVATARGPIAVQKSGVYIPDEMVKGETAAAFQQVVDRDLAPRVEHEISILMKQSGIE